MPHDIEDIFAAALTKYREGAGKYGRYEPLTDSRDMIREAEEEILDGINLSLIHISEPTSPY